jgi:DNA-binding NarL/FixJ family response regulator
MLEGEGVDCAEAGYLLVPDGLAQVAGGDLGGALATYERVVEAGTRFDDPDLVALGLMGMGEVRIHAGEVQAGMTLLDESMVGVAAGEVSPLMAGLVYCAVIGACNEAADLRRSQEWTEALSRWCASQPDLVRYRGQCLVHRVELMTWQGRWDEALAEVVDACRLLVDHPAVGAALYQAAEVHRLRGDHQQAEDAYRRASVAGRTAQPGLALLRLEQGRTEAAAAAVRCARPASPSPMAEASLAVAAVEILVSAGDLDEARRASEGVHRLATRLGSPLLEAMAATAATVVRSEEGDVAAALAAAHLAVEGWRRLGVPYELARATARRGIAHRAAGDEDSAAVDLDDARRAFVRLGAVPAVTWLDDCSRRRSPPIPGDLTDREVEVLALVATGCTNRDVAAELCISEHTVARHLQNIFTKLDVPSRTAATRVAVDRHLV